VLSIWTVCYLSSILLINKYNKIVQTVSQCIEIFLETKGNKYLRLLDVVTLCFELLQSLLRLSVCEIRILHIDHSYTTHNTNQHRHL